MRSHFLSMEEAVSKRTGTEKQHKKVSMKWKSSSKEIAAIAVLAFGKKTMADSK